MSLPGFLQFRWTKVLWALLAVGLGFAVVSTSGRSDLSGVVRWSQVQARKTPSGQVRTMLAGSSRDLGDFEISTLSVEAGKSGHENEAHERFEELVVVQSGRIDVSLGQRVTALGPNGVAVFMAGDSHEITNRTDAPAGYLRFRYRSIASNDPARARKAGGSFVVEADAVDRDPKHGERRDLFDRPTGMLALFEMHLSTVGVGQSNHAPHTHRPAQVTLVVEGDVEILVRGRYYRAGPGDIAFIESERPHALRNVGNVPAEYAVFRWR